MLAESAGIGVDAAFARIRGYARDRNRRLSDVAHDLIEGRVEAATLAPTSS